MRVTMPSRNYAWRAAALIPGWKPSGRAKPSSNRSQKNFWSGTRKTHQKPTTYAGTKRHVEKTLIPAWGHLPIATINRRHVHIVLDDLVDAGKGTTANRVLATISKLFNWSVERGYLDASPAVAREGTRQRTVSRDRVLEPERDQANSGRQRMRSDIRGGRGSNSCSPQAASAKATSHACNGERSGAPGGRSKQPTKSNSPAIVCPLSTFAHWKSLDAIPRFEGPYVFSTRAGEKPVRGFSKAKALLDKKSKVIWAGGFMMSVALSRRTSESISASTPM